MALKFSTLFALAAACGLAVSAPAANAALAYAFSQAGFDGGGGIAGTFEATDANGDGFITTAEVSAFSLSFSGDSAVPDFSQGLAELYVLNYKTGTPFLGDEVSGSFYEAIGTNWFGAAGFSYASGMGAGGFGGSVEDLAAGGLSRSDELVAVSAAPVPVPAAFWLFGSALSGLAGLGRRKRA
jgi:hypothetical protein